MYVKRVDQREWLPAYAGAERAVLHMNRQEGRTSLVRVKAGTRGPRHNHLAGEHAFLISGKVEVAGEILRPGDYLYTEPGEVHDLYAHEDSLLIASTERPIQVLEQDPAATKAA